MVIRELKKIHPPPPEQEKEQPVKHTEEEFGINMETEDFSHHEKPGQPEKQESD